MVSVGHYFAFTKITKSFSCSTPGKIKKKPENFDHVKSDSCPKDVTRMLEFNCRDLQENKKINIHRLSLARLNWLLFLRSNNHHPHLKSQNGWGWKGPLKIV